LQVALDSGNSHGNEQESGGTGLAYCKVFCYGGELLGGKLPVHKQVEGRGREMIGHAANSPDGAGCAMAKQSPGDGKEE
jgi:hypothetical protein